MKREVILSLLLHLTVVFFTILSSPFDIKKTTQYDEVIKIRAVTLPDFSPAAPVVQETEPVTIPEAVADEPAEIPIDDPTSVDEPKKTEKPTPKPAKKPPQDTPSATDETPPATGNGDQTEIDVAGTGTGSPFAGATIDNASFEYPYWFTQTFNKIASSWRNTVVYDGSLVCVVYFQVIRSGRVIDVRVEFSSGVTPFDETCLTAIERAAPFPPLPREFRDEIIGITLPFKYEPR
ncbi:MAG: TonB family protein [candidate division Zixibacteria bacterium]|nr:TonB family protein [candidate division Zixibacteria bacterium]